jgi:hypothetical protein
VTGVGVIELQFVGRDLLAPTLGAGVSHGVEPVATLPTLDHGVSVVPCTVPSDVPANLPQHLTALVR